MRILISNDDGVTSAGLLALAEVFSKEHDVTVIAPDSERSATSHSIQSFLIGIKYKLLRKEKNLAVYSCTGSPADCIRLGVHKLMDKPPELILSGINRGVNLGLDVLYSGTVSAATEGAYLGIRSIAVSTDSRDYNDSAIKIAEYVKSVMPEFLASGWTNTTIININYPNGMPLLGARYAKLEAAAYGTIFEAADERDSELLFLRGGRKLLAESEDGDVSLFNKGYITVSAINLDRNDYMALERFKEKVRI